MCFSPLAKLGDTQELEEFIADLDKVLEGAYAARSLPLPSPKLCPAWQGARAGPLLPLARQSLALLPSWLGLPVRGASSLVLAAGVESLSLLLRGVGGPHLDVTPPSPPSSFFSWGKNSTA